MDWIVVTAFIVTLNKQLFLLHLLVLAKFLRTSEVDNKTITYSVVICGRRLPNGNGLQQFTFLLNLVKD